MARSSRPITNPAAPTGVGRGAPAANFPVPYTASQGVPVFARFAAFCLACTVLQAQPVPTRAIGKMVSELEEPFSGVLDLRELSNKGLVVLDGKDNILSFVPPDFATVKAVSRQGSGPTEYRQLLQLIARGGDSTLAYDVLNARFLVVDARGSATGTISLRDAASGMPVGPAQVRGYDTRGRLYYQGIKVSMGKAGPAVSETTFVLRLDPAAKRIDTLGQARMGMPGMKMSGDPAKGTAKVALTMPVFPVVDEWALMPNGEVLIVRGSNYQMEFFGAGGGPRRLAPIAYVPVKVTEGDKVEVRRQVVEAEKAMKKAVAGAASAVGSQRPPPGMSLGEPDEWPATKPAFGQGALKVAPDGEIWVLRHREAANPAPMYDVFSPAGKLKFRVELAKKTRLAGIGAQHLYIVREDADELQYLGKYPRPSA